MTQTHPLIGTAVWVCKEGKILLARRAQQKKEGAGYWSPPGGHLEMYETIKECALRETREEAGVEVSNMQLIKFLEAWQPETGSHYVTFHYAADWLSGEPRPQAGESEEWHWFAWDELPHPLFRPTEDLLKAGINPLEF